MSTMQKTDNTIPVEAWNTVLFEKYNRFRYVLTNGLSGHSDALLDRRPYDRGARVLDVGCGFGDTTRQIAQQVAPSGRALGVDCAENFVDVAERESTEAGIENVSYFTGDVQSGNLQGPYDHAFSRFGTMFFNMPVLALRNIGKALKPGGTLTMIVWRRREDNPWVHKAELLVREIVPVISHEDTDQVHCGPGPFSMAGPDTVSDMLRSAGFDRISFERYDTDVCIGQSMDEAIDFAMALGPAGEIIRLAGAEGRKREPQVIAALREALAPHEQPNGIWAASSSWFVTVRTAS